jgi:TrmH family RNA methyltransferase
VAPSLRDDDSPRARRLLDALDRAGCRLHLAPEEIVESLTEGRSSGGILGLVRREATSSLPDLLAGGGARPILLVAVDVEDPGNVGALTRTALASGAVGLAAVGISDPFHPRAVRISRGSVFKLPVLQYPQAEPLLRELASLGISIVGAVSSGGVGLPRANFGRGGVALLVGSEAFGLPEGLLSRLDLRVTVPMVPDVDSFSVNAATAVILYEIRRSTCVDDGLIAGDPAGG